MQLPPDKKIDVQKGDIADISAIRDDENINYIEDVSSDGKEILVQGLWIPTYPI